MTTTEARNLEDRDAVSDFVTIFKYSKVSSGLLKMKELRACRFDFSKPISGKLLIDEMNVRMCY